LAQKPERKILGQELYALHGAGYTFEELGKKYGMTQDAVKGLIRTARLSIDPKKDVVHLGSPLELAGNFLIVGDVHVPATDWAFASLVGRVADKTGIRRLVIGGDFFNQDLWSRYPQVVTQPTWREERDAARVLLHDWLEVFDEIYTIHGNHDRRLAKFTAGEFDESDVWGLVATSRKMHHSNRGYCTVNSGGQVWRVTHPRNYGRNQLTVASDLANKYQCHVITFHEHHSAIGWDVYGHYVCVNSGTLVDPRKLAYVELEDNRMAAMLKSFVVLRDGVVTVLGEHPYTDWRAWLN
jgi:hypothetical protein